MIDDGKQRRRGTQLVSYFALIALTVGGFLAVRAFGRDLVAPVPGAAAQVFGAGDSKVKVDVLMHVLLALAVIIVTARVLGAVFAWARQPAVIGEVLAGIFLGPSLLGRLSPEAAAFLLPPSVAPFLSILSQVGVLLYMFMVGLQLDFGMMRARTHATVAISHASIIVPFLLGSVLALALYPRVATSDVPFTVFALFCGVSMSVTAFPVLARILTDRSMHKSQLGTMALTCAAVDDVTAWCLLAFVVSIANTQVGGAVRTAIFTVVYIVLVFTVLRPLVRRVINRYDDQPAPPHGLVAAIFVALLVSALITEWIGIHAIFGAFLLGTIIPHESKIAGELVRKLEDIVVILLLPAFFAYTGMRTQMSLVSGVTEWLLCALIIATASVGKFGGSTLAARISGLSWRDSAALGILMNTRGLMELIVLNIGLDLKVISPELFAMLVIMAVVTTFATTPILHLVMKGSSSSAASMSSAAK
ncbi:MAG: cation:proton antiporter [Deltaproteobacteria bacterium]|nr:cation:proton antiporter [Deltaproteobacteria bacterium]